MDPVLRANMVVGKHVVSIFAYCGLVVEIQIHSTAKIF